MTRTKKALLSVGAGVLLLVGSAVFLPTMMCSDGVDYAHAISIKTAPEYQQAALLERAWALPVAQRYKAGVDFQINGSFCGPASVVNVMRSLGTQASQSTVLEGTDAKTVMGVLPGGLTLDQLAEIARKKLGGKVTVLRDL